MKLIADLAREALANQAKFYEAELKRLKEIETVYQKLCCLISVIEESNPFDNTVVLTITKANAVSSDSWEQILRRAIGKPDPARVD